MSRCFPFPAPGYEKKARLDDEVLLTKEKHKEKKQKKDKKGKDKNTDRNKEKRCGRKDRKEKHRDKNKSKDESKNWIPSEKRVEGNQECYSGEKKLVSNGQQSWEINGSKYVHELDRRIKAEDRASGSQELQNFAASDKKRVELPKQLEGKPDEHDWKVHKPRNHVKEKYETNSVCPKFSNMHQRRIEDRASGSQELRNLTANDKKSVELPKQLEGTPEEHDRKINKLRNHVKEKYETNSVCPNFSNMHQRRIEDRASGSQELRNFTANDKKSVELPIQLEGTPEEHDRKINKLKNHVKEKYETNSVCPNFSNMHQRRIEDRASGSQELRNFTANDKKSVELPKQLEGTPEEHDRKINKLRNHVKEKYETNSVCPNFSNMHQRRIEDRASGSQELRNFTANDKKSVELPIQLEGTPEEHDRKINKLKNHVKEKYETNSVCPNFSNMHQRKIEDRASGSRELRNFTANDKKSVELLKQLEGTPEEHDLKINKLRNHVKEKYETNSACPNFSNMHQRKIEQINTSFKKHVEKHIEVKNENKEKDMTEDNGHEKKRKSNAKAGVREKEKKKKVEKENKSHIEQPKHIRNGKESINAWNAKISQLPQMNNNSASSGIHKCKNFEMNEHSLGNGFLPHKVPMGTSSHLSTENGKCEPLQAAIQGTSKRPRATNNGEVDVKGANDIKGHERPRVTLTKTLSSTAQVTRRNGEPLAKQSDSKSDNGNGEPFVKQSDPKSNIGNGELFTKPPHPDSKYLSQILSVPEIGELCDCDQEWLFNSNNLQAKKPKMSSLNEGSPQVWEQTLQINFADVFALPYVIPY